MLSSKQFPVVISDSLPERSPQGPTSLSVAIGVRLLQYAEPIPRTDIVHAPEKRYVQLHNRATHATCCFFPSLRCESKPSANKLLRTAIKPVLEQDPFMCELSLVAHFAGRPTQPASACVGWPSACKVASYLPHSRRLCL